MPVTVDGTIHLTIEEAAHQLNVHAKTIRSWINAGILPEPSVVQAGLIDRRYFTEEYLQKAKTIINGRREEKRARKRSHHQPAVDSQAPPQPAERTDLEATPEQPTGKLTEAEANRVRALEAKASLTREEDEELFSLKLRSFAMPLPDEKKKRLFDLEGQRRFTRSLAIPELNELVALQIEVYNSVATQFQAALDNLPAPDREREGRIELLDPGVGGRIKQLVDRHNAGVNLRLTESTEMIEILLKAIHATIDRCIRLGMPRKDLPVILDKPATISRRFTDLDEPATTSIRRSSLERTVSSDVPTSRK